MLKHRYQYVPNLRAECCISGLTAPREMGSDDLYSPWSSDLLYAHQFICFSVTILQHSIKVSTGKHDLRLGKLSKSVRSFCKRCGLVWCALGGLRMPISSWAISEKTLKNMICGRKNVAHFTPSLVLCTIFRHLMQTRYASKCEPAFWNPHKMKVYIILFKIAH